MSVSSSSDQYVLADLSKLEKTFRRRNRELNLMVSNLEANITRGVAKRTSYIINSINADYDSYTNKLDYLSTIIGRIHSIDDLPDEKETTYETHLNTLFTKRNELSGKINDLMEPVPEMHNLGGGGGPNNANDAPVKVASALKPESLTKEMSPAQLRQWISQYKTYFNQSNFQKLSLTDQQNVLLACLSQNLQTTMSTRFTNSMPTFGNDESCMAELITLWDQLYPLLSRQINLFKATQANNQRFTSYISYMTRLEQGCDLATLDAEKIFVLLLLRGCTDEKLLTELLKAKKLDSRGDVEAVAIDYERRNKDVTCINQQRQSVNATSAYKQQQKQKQRDGGGGATSSNPKKKSKKGNSTGTSTGDNNKNGGNQKKEKRANNNTCPPKYKDMCAACGSKSHKSVECENRASQKCTFCDTTGSHATHVCYKKYWAENDKPKASANMVNHGVFMANASMTMPDLEVDPPPLMEIQVIPLD